MPDQLYAYTPPGGNYPAYINFSCDGNLVVMVRGPIQLADGNIPYDLPGQTATVVIPLGEVPTLIAALQKMLAPKPAHQDEDDGA